MNNIRRKKLTTLYEQIEELKTLLEDVHADEEEAFDNIPENLEGSERYEKSQEAVENLDCAISALEEALECIEAAQE